MFKKILLAAVLALTLSPARAQTQVSPTDNKYSIAATMMPAPQTPAEIKAQRQFMVSYRKCLASETRIVRLSCFDQVAQDMRLIPADQKKKEDQIIGTYGFWRAIFSQDEMMHQVTTLKLDSATDYNSANGLEIRPTLTLKCQLAKTDVYLDWQIPLNSNIARKTLPISFSIDGFPPVNQEWQLSGDNFAMYAPDPAKMIRALKTHVKLVVTVTPDNEATGALTYDLPGFDEALQILVQRCYPKGSDPMASKYVTPPPGPAPLTSGTPLQRVIPGADKWPAKNPSYIPTVDSPISPTAPTAPQ